MKLVVLMAVSGAGKDYFIEHNMPQANWMASADNFFMQGDRYVFDASKLGEAHGACFREVIDALQRGSELIVVNNTNTSVAEIAPYMAAAQAYGAEANIICLRIDPKIAAARNTHGTPLATIEKMAERLERTLKELPPWWDKEVLQWDPGTSSYRLA